MRTLRTHSKPTTIRTAIIGVGGTILVFLADTYLKPKLPQTITNIVLASVIVVVASVVSSWLWHKRSAAISLATAGALSAIAVSIPTLTPWAIGVAAIAGVIWLALPRIAVWTARWRPDETSYHRWVDKHSAIQMIRDALLNSNRDYESDSEIRQRLVNGVLNGTLKGVTDHGGANTRLSSDNIEQALSQYGSSANFWSKGLDELLEQIKRGKL